MTWDARTCAGAEDAYVSPPPSVQCVGDGGATDDQLSGLLDSIRRYIRDAPAGTWTDQVHDAARVVTAAVSNRLAGDTVWEEEGGG